MTKYQYKTTGCSSCKRCSDIERFKRVLDSVKVDVMTGRRRRIFIPIIRNEQMCLKMSSKFVFACSNKTKNKITNTRQKMIASHKKGKLQHPGKIDYDMEDDEEDDFEHGVGDVDFNDDDQFAAGLLTDTKPGECQITIPKLFSTNISEFQSSVIDRTINLMNQFFMEYKTYANPCFYIQFEKWRDIAQMIEIDDSDTAKQECKSVFINQIKICQTVKDIKQILVPFKHLDYICMYVISLEHKAAYLLHPNLQSIVEDRLEAPHFRIISKTFTPSLKFILESFEEALQDHYAEEIQVKRNEINELIRWIEEDKFPLYNFTTPQLKDSINISQEYLMAFNITKVGKSYGYTSRNFRFDCQAHADKIVKYINRIHKMGFIYGFMDV